jgi:hypothetical protein
MKCLRLRGGNRAGKPQAGSQESQKSKHGSLIPLYPRSPDPLRRDSPTPGGPQRAKKMQFLHFGLAQSTMHVLF